MESTSFFVSYFGFIIEFTIPNSGLRWEKQVISVFKKNYIGYIPRSKVITKSDITIRFVESKTDSKLRSNKLTYIVPTTTHFLDRKKFGQLLREIVISALLFLTRKMGGVCLHASSASHNGKAILFIGNSGSGKSTICQLLSSDFIKLTDDTTFLIHKKSWITSPLPVFEKKIPLRFRSSSLQLKVVALYFIKQGSRNNITELTKDAGIFQRLLDNTLYTGSVYEIAHVKALIDTSIPCYQLEFTKSKKIGSLVKQFLD
jgi:hypothetical protein